MFDRMVQAKVARETFPLKEQIKANNELLLVSKAMVEILATRTAFLTCEKDKCLLPIVLHVETEKVIKTALAQALLQLGIKK
jgi:hypothetical protein